MNLDTRLAEVKSTKDYDLFKKINYNRSVMEPRIDKIVESIKKYGFILPILVNKEFMVVDGQHRLEAAKKAGSNVLYIQFNISDDMLPILISTVNTTSKNWTLDDYLNMWVALQKDTYVYISEIMDRENFGISAFLKISAATGSGKNSGSVKFKNGELRYTKAQKERVVTRVSFLNDIRDISVSYEDFRNSPSFVMAIMCVIVNPDYKHDRMMQVLEASPGSIAKSKAVSDYLEVFSTLYNKGLKKRTRFAR